MCKLGEQKRTEVVEEKNAKTMFRWFLAHKFKNGNVTLTPVFKKASRVWQSKVAKAHRSPVNDNYAGLYAYNSVSEATKDKPYDLAILAEVKVWGKTAVHSNGRRSHFGKIVRLFSNKFSHEKVYSYKEGKYISAESMVADFKDKLVKNTYFGHLRFQNHKVKTSKKASPILKKKKASKKKTSKSKKK